MGPINPSTSPTAIAIFCSTVPSGRPLTGGRSGAWAMSSVGSARRLSFPLVVVGRAWRKPMWLGTMYAGRSAREGALQRIGAGRTTGVGRDHEGHDLLPRPLTLDATRGGPDTWAVGEAGLDRLQFDPVAADFHLRINPSLAEELPGRVAVDEVAGSVDSPKLGVDGELPGSHFRIVPISARQPRAAETQLPGFADLDFFQPVIQHPRPQPWQRADRWRSGRPVG